MHGNFNGYSGLNENGPYTLTKHPGPSWHMCLGRTKRCALVGKGASLGQALRFQTFGISQTFRHSLC